MRKLSLAWLCAVLFCGCVFDVLLATSTSTHVEVRAVMPATFDTLCALFKRRFDGYLIHLLDSHGMLSTDDRRKLSIPDVESNVGVKVRFEGKNVKDGKGFGLRNINENDLVP